MEYLETVGTASWIDTKVTGNDNTIQIDFEWMPVTKGTYSSVMGNHETEEKSCWRFIHGASSIPNSVNFTLNDKRAGASPRSTIDILDTIAMHKFDVHLEYASGYIKYSGTKYYAGTHESTLEEQSTLTIAIGINGPTKGQGITNAPHNRFYWFQIKKQGELVRNYIPCYRISDNKAGFYDIINNTFNISEGAEDFISGSALPKHSDILQYRRNILLNSPHLTTVTSGNTSDSETIAHFKTDMAAPIKSLKVNFAPV